MIKFSFSHTMEKNLQTHNPFTTEMETEIRAIVSRNFESIFASQGAAIGVSWQGRDLIESGSLLSQLKDPLVGQGWVSIQAPPYATYVNELYPFLSVTDNAKREILSVYTEHVGRLFR